MDEAELWFPNCSILFVLLLPYVGEHYHEEELGHFCWLRQDVFRATFWTFHLTTDSILRLWLFLLISRNRSELFPFAVHHTVTMRSFWWNSGFWKCFGASFLSSYWALCVVIEIPLFITRYDVFEKWMVLMPQQQSWTEVVTSFFSGTPSIHA